MAPASPAIELKNMSKSFGPIRANNNISLKIEKGTIHGIVGENGAGKSTLMNILYGLHRADTGEMLIDGQPVNIHSSADAIQSGIGMVHQHFMLVPNFTVLENVMLGTEGGILLKQGRKETRRVLENFANQYAMFIDPDALVGELAVGLQQRVEIIKALKGGARILILDEPTGVLTPPEVEKLFDILNMLKQGGVTILLITHKLEEIMAVTDNVSIMRQGEMVGHRKTADTTPEEMAELMVGRKVLLRVEKTEAIPGAPLIAVQNLNYTSKSGAQLLEKISFEIKAGEILGVAGVAGNGQSELLEVLTGMLKPTKGTVSVLGKNISSDHTIKPDEMRKLGVAHIPEDRHKHGLVLSFEAHENAVLGRQNSSLTGNGILLNRDKTKQHCKALMESYDVRPPNPSLAAKNFSGGNQQKLVIAREMHDKPKVLIIGQPTRGVDIGAIEFIHKELIKRRDEGCAILLVSVELEEIFALADRILVMNNGKQVGLVARKDADEKSIGLMMAGVSNADAPGDAA